jgi:hypothetical protein
VIPYDQRPRELAHLLNPAFLSVLIARASSGYKEEADAAFPFSLAFLTLPLILHRTTRERLPHTTRTRMTAWLQDSPDVRVGFAERTRALVPYAREAIIFALYNGALRLTESGDIETTSPRLISRELRGSDMDEANECLRRASFVGRWLARAGSASTVYALWGIRP